MFFSHFKLFACPVWKKNRFTNIYFLVFPLFIHFALTRTQNTPTVPPFFFWPLNTLSGFFYIYLCWETNKILNCPRAPVHKLTINAFWHLEGEGYMCMCEHVQEDAHASYCMNEQPSSRYSTPVLTSPCSHPSKYKSKLWKWQRLAVFVVYLNFYKRVKKMTSTH